MNRPWLTAGLFAVGVLCVLLVARMLPPAVQAQPAGASSPAPAVSIPGAQVGAPGQFPRSSIAPLPNDPVTAATPASGQPATMPTCPAPSAGSLIDRYTLTGRGCCPHYIADEYQPAVVTCVPPVMVPVRQ